MAEQRGRPFQPGNKFGRGRPPGSRNKEKIPGGQLLEQFEPSLVAKAITTGLDGNNANLRACLRLLYEGGRKVKFLMKKIRTRKDITETHQRLLQDVGKGKLSLSEGESLFRMLDAVSREMDRGII